MAATVVHAETAMDVRDVSLDDLLDQKVEVATRTVRKNRDTPGVVTVLTRDEIIASGARDLMELLQLVSGFTFHIDVQNTLGIGFRGLWGHEGKVLLLLDGIEMNELLYSTEQFGQHYLLHNVDRVEVIRGPGSAVYGGTAELAVINVVSRTGKQLQGAEVTTRGALMASGATVGDGNVSLSVGGMRESDGLDISASAYVGKGERTNGTYTDFNGNSISLVHQATTSPLLATVAFNWKGVKTRLLYDDYRVVAPDGYGTILTTDPHVRFRTAAIDTSFDGALTPTLHLKPRMTFRWQNPWENTDPDSEMYYSKWASRLTAGTALAWDPTDTLDVLTGIEGQWDHAAIVGSPGVGSMTDFQGSPTVNYGTLAAYAQILWDTPIVNVALGGRYEYQNVYGSNFAPRIGLTRSYGPAFAKLLYSAAFRSPGIEDINLGSFSADGKSNVRPERAHVAEVELGWQISDVALVTANGFWMLLQHPIVYSFNEQAAAEVYTNGNPLATAGAELEITSKGRLGSVRAAYSLAVSTRNEVPSYQVPGVTGRNLAFPNHKVTMFGQWKMTSQLRMGGQFVFLSSSDAYVRPTEALDGTGEIGQIPASAMLSLWVGTEDLWVKGLQVQLGMGNIFNSQMPFAQPYSGHAPIPGRPRDVFLRLSYGVKFLE